MPIDDYLDVLMLRLLDDPSRNEDDVAAIRRAVAESEDHLRETQRAAMDDGGGDVTAAQLAVDGSGRSTRSPAGSVKPAPAAPTSPSVPVVRSLWLMGGIGLVAIGVSGVVASILGCGVGTGFVSADLPGVTYTAAAMRPVRRAGARATRRANKPPSRTTSAKWCSTASPPACSALLVLVAYSAWIFLARRTGRSTSLIPTTWFEAVGTAIFGVAAAALLLVSVGQELSGPAAGTGQYLSAGIVSLAVAEHLRRRTGALGHPHRPAPLVAGMAHLFGDQARDATDSAFQALIVTTSASSAATSSSENSCRTASKSASGTCVAVNRVTDSVKARAARSRGEKNADSRHTTSRCEPSLDLTERPGVAAVQVDAVRAAVDLGGPEPHELAQRGIEVDAVELLDRRWSRCVIARR